MAKRKNKQKKKPAAMPVRVRKHIDALGFRSVSGYRHWCIDHGFKSSTDKSYEELAEEFDAHGQDQERHRSLSRIHDNPAQLITQACASELDCAAMTRPKWREFCLAVQQSRNAKQERRTLCDLLLLVNDRADFLFELHSFGHQSYQFVDALIQLNHRRRQWIRPLDDWRSTTRNRRRQFSSLVRHLLTEYPVPEFMDSAWFRRDERSYLLRDWFIHIGWGKNIRTANTPVKFTKRMAHHFMEAPDSCSIENAIRWGQVHALGGDRQLTEALLGTPIADSFDNDDFWQTVIRFFTSNPLLDRRHIGPIVDYLNHQKFVTREIFIGPGIIETEPPPQPGLTMRGRTPTALLRQVEDWHRELGRKQKISGQYFARSGVKEYSLRTGKDKMSRWTIRELLSGDELVREGKAMKHCVATYAESCARGYCSIWTMELHQANDACRKYQTIEVARSRVIVQCRGKRNRLPTAREFRVLKLWAETADLSISPYIQIED